MPRGYFITFEGLDGSGKTTQLRRLAASLEAEGHKVVTLRQPGGTALGDRIRSILLDSKSEAALGPIAPAAEMALMFADRAQSIAEIILPALAAGSIVLCDRYTDSSEAYQGGGRQLGSERILAMHAAACDNLQPDLTLLLLPSLESSLNRARRRNQRHAAKQGTDENRFERESDDFYRRIYEKYEEIAAREPQRVVAIRDDAPSKKSKPASKKSSPHAWRHPNHEPRDDPRSSLLSAFILLITVTPSRTTNEPQHDHPNPTLEATPESASESTKWRMPPASTTLSPSTPSSPGSNSATPSASSSTSSKPTATSPTTASWAPPSSSSTTPTTSAKSSSTSPPASSKSAPSAA